MTVAVLILVALTAVGGLALTVLDERLRPAWAALVLVAPLGIAAVLAWVADPVSGALLQAVVLLAVGAAVTAGGPVATAVLRSADPTSASTAGGPSDPEVLRGGAWIGVLERAAVAGTLLAGWPEGLAVVLAVKGLGRFAELRAPAAAERFILGTLASALWAVACVGVVVLVRR
jgi:hypothetical protein